jgi:hypothetical protein
MRRIERELRTRYEADYRVVLEASAEAGLEALRVLGEAGDEVAPVLADQQMRGTSEGSIAIQQVHEYLSMAQCREEGSDLPARATPATPS